MSDDEFLPKLNQPQQHRHIPGCSGKHRYQSKKEALTTINRNKYQRGRHGRPEGLRAYSCNYCGGWHLTKHEKR